VADEMERRAAAVDEPWVTAAAVRGRGLAAFAAGDADAVPRLGEAAAIFDELGYRLDAARALLLQAKALRRAGLRRRSAEALADAQARFRALGTEPWEAQTEAEIRRVAPTRETTDLTPTESRVVALVAAGRRNREIAGELNISVATVEAHLTRIYRKLQVRSRTELVTVVR
jgi:DNA-binding CsgD family transcriptional regulator